MKNKSPTTSRVKLMSQMETKQAVMKDRRQKKTEKVAKT